MLTLLWQFSPCLTNKIVLPLAQISPIVLRVRNSLRATGTGNWVFWVFGAIVLGSIILLTVWSRWRDRHEITPGIYDNPEQLFKSLLSKLELSALHKSVLNKMAADTRLRHPSEILLSPVLLNWSRDLWVKEKGYHAIGPEKLRVIEEISDAIYGYHIG